MRAQLDSIQLTLCVDQVVQSQAQDREGVGMMWAVVWGVCYRVD